MINLKLQRDELTGLEEEQHRLLGHETERAHILGFLDYLDATHLVAPIGPGLGRDRIEEISCHYRLCLNRLHHYASPNRICDTASTFELHFGYALANRLT